MKIRNFLKKTLAVLLAFAMLAPIMGNLKVNLKEVKAEETSSDDRLNVKCQVTQGVVTDTNVNKYRGNYVIRFVSAVTDYTAYSEIGFKVMEEGQTESEAKTAKVKTVFKRIESTTGSTATEQETYTFSPKVINTDSEYFITAKLPVTPANKAVKYTVWAYGIKKDGTPVEGQKRCLSVEDGQKDCETINMSFENTSSDDLTGLTLKANDTYDAKVIGVNDKTVHVRISDVPKPLKSATSFTFKNGDTKVGSGTFRNLYTEYDPDGDGTGTADDSWYTEYSAVGDTEFTIATSADLYGLASLVNASEDNVTFADKTIYVVSDIKANKGTAKDTGWVAATGASIYPWTSIGTSSKPFSGTFDGCMHSISGISLSATSNNAGFFGYVKTDANATSPVTVKNLKLTNSYLTSTNANFGSVAGYANGGVFDTVKSDAFVATSNARAGGFIGFGNAAVSMNNCWFTGQVTTSLSGKNIRTGGFMGTMYSGTLDMTNCLNTGAVSATSSEGYMKVSGFVGEASSSDKATATVNFTDCLNAGTVTKGSGNYGAFVGYTWTNATVNAYTSYNTDASASASIVDYKDEENTVNVYDDSNTAITVADMSVDSSAITGDAATSETGLAGFDFDNTWIVVTNGTPVLKSFEDEIINPDTSWYSEEGGTAENPFVLYDKNDLYGFANLVNAGNNFAGKVIRLGDDIVINKGDAEDYAECVPQFEWTPIGTATTAFAGTFDGSDPETGEIYTISGIYLNASTTNTGLFGYTAGGSAIQNLKLKNSYFNSTAGRVGSIAGEFRGTLDTVYSDAIVTSSANYAGGLIAMASNSTSYDVDINNCWFAGTVSTTGTSTKYTGGLVAWAYAKSLDITNCLNTGTVTSELSGGYPIAAGFVGSIHNNTTVTVTDCLQAGSIIAESASKAGAGIAGNINAATSTLNIYTSYVDTDKCSVATGYRVGTVTLYGADNKQVESITASNYLPSAMQLSVGTTETGVITGFDCENVWEVTDATPILKSFAGGVIAPDTTWYDADSDTCTLYNAADLYGFSKLSQSNNFEGKKVQLGADIVVNDGDAEDWAESAPYYSWMPIGQKTAFKGTFDGADPEDPDVIHSISGLYFETSTKSSGLFGQIAGTDAAIKNLKLTNSYFGTSNQNIGSIVGYANGGNIDTVYSDATVVASKERVGGVIGMGASTVTITNSWFAGTVTNVSTRTGGFVGDQNSGSLSMTNCLNSGLVDVSGYVTDYHPRAAGLVGNLTTGTVTLDKCLNTGIKCVYDAATTVYGAFTGYLASSTSLNITQTYADVDKWGSVGYYSIKNENDDGTPITTYNTVNGKYGNDYVDEVKEELAVLLLEHSAVIGDAAKTNLSGFDFDSTWTVLSDGTVALTKFAGMKVADTEKTALHSKLVSSQCLVANNAEKIVTLPEPDTIGSVYYQGGCTPDGNYFYQAAITYKDTETENNGAEVDNQVQIVRYELSTGEAVWSDAIALNHANDITYNSDLDCFVVCHNTGNPTRVSYLKINDAGKLEAVDENNDGVIDGADLTYSGYSIDYNATYDRYVVGRSEAEYFDVYDADFNRLYSFEAKDEYKGIIESGTYTGNVPQGISCDDNYIYHLINGYKEDESNVVSGLIVIYDWYGTFVTKIDLSSVVEHEPENVSVVGDAIYVTDVYHLSIGNIIKYDTATIYRINASNIGQ